MTPEASHIKFTNGRTRSYRKNKVNSAGLYIYIEMVSERFIYLFIYLLSYRGQYLHIVYLTVIYKAAGGGGVKILITHNMDKKEFI